jgi:energy-converting hydrogenase Eha subunit B
MSEEQVFGVLLAAIIVTCIAAFAALFVWLWYRVLNRTGYSGWLGLLILVPFGNLALLLVLAFGEWPIARELTELRQRVGSG